MTRISVVDDSTEWQEDLRLRLRASYAKSGLGAEAAERRLQEVGAGAAAEISGDFLSPQRNIVMKQPSIAWHLAKAASERYWLWRAY